MKPKPLTDKAINQRTVWAVIDDHNNIDANRIYRYEQLQAATDLASCLSKETGARYLVIPIILK